MKIGILALALLIGAGLADGGPWLDSSLRAGQTKGDAISVNTNLGLGSQAQHGVSLSASSPEAVHKATRYSVVYVVPPDPADPTADGRAYLRTLDASASKAIGDDIFLGNFTGIKTAFSDPTGAYSRDSVLLESNSDLETVSIQGATPNEPRSERTPSTVLVPMAAMAPDGTLFEVEDVNVVGRDASGKVVVSFPLPVPPYGQPSLDGKPIKIDLMADASNAAALLVGPDKHVYTFVDNSVNSALVDLTDSRRMDLPGIGWINSATFASNGMIYAVGWDPSKSGDSLQILQIDASSMKVVQDIDSGIRPSGSSIDSISLVAIGRDAYLYVNESVDSSQQKGTLLRVDAAASSTKTIPLPNNLGLTITTGVDGRMYFYAGLAANKVSTYDPISGQLSSVDLLDAPPGSYIEAVIVR